MVDLECERLSTTSRRGESVDGGCAYKTVAKRRFRSFQPRVKATLEEQSERGGDHHRDEDKGGRR